MIGNTLLAERGIVPNITLMRAHDMKTFRDAEVRAFARVSRRMTRALQMAIRLERPDTCPTSISAFDAMPQAIAVIDAQRHVLYANAARESVRTRKHGLCVRNGEIHATHAGTRQRFEACVADAVAIGARVPGGVAPLVLPGGAHRHSSLHSATPERRQWPGDGDHLRYGPRLPEDRVRQGRRPHAGPAGRPRTRGPRELRREVAGRPSPTLVSIRLRAEERIAPVDGRERLARFHGKRHRRSSCPGSRRCSARPLRVLNQPAAPVPGMPAARRRRRRRAASPFPASRPHRR